MDISHEMLELCKSLQEQLNRAIPKAEKRLKREEQRREKND